MKQEAGTCVSGGSGDPGTHRAGAADRPPIGTTGLPQSLVGAIWFKEFSGCNTPWVSNAKLNLGSFLTGDGGERGEPPCGDLPIWPQ